MMSKKIKNDLIGYLYPKFIDDVDYTVSKQYNNLLYNNMQSDDIAKIMSEAINYPIMCREDYHGSFYKAYTIKIPSKVVNFDIFEQKLLQVLEKNSKLKIFYHNYVSDEKFRFVGFTPDVFTENPFVADRKKALSFFKEEFERYFNKKWDTIKSLYLNDDDEFDTVIDDFLNFVRDVAIENNFGDIFIINSKYSKLIKLFFDTVMFVAKKSK